MTTTCLPASTSAPRTLSAVREGRPAVGRMVAQAGILVGMAGSLAAVMLRLG